jgi:hypothetical protein
VLAGFEAESYSYPIDSQLLKSSRAKVFDSPTIFFRKAGTCAHAQGKVVDSPFVRGAFQV